MLDQAGIRMAQGAAVAGERIAGINDNMYQPHYHNYYEIYYLEDGGRYQCSDNDLYLLQPGDIILFPPYQMHYSYGDANMHFQRIVLYFRREEIDSPDLIRILEEGNGIFRPDARERSVIHQALMNLLKEQEEERSFAKECCHSLLNFLLYHLARQTRMRNPVKAEQNRRIAQIMRYIHTHYNEAITLESLSEQFYISTFYLCREFRSYTNSTVVQYINVTRIMNAQRMLMETSKNITQVGRETGFSSPTHFNRVFKQITGMTPSGFRKSHKNIEIYLGGAHANDAKKEER